MEQALAEDLLNWAELLQSRCFELNEALIKANKLDNKTELADCNSFSWPARAVRLKLIPRIGSINDNNKEYSFTYHIHGTGITIRTAVGENIHFEYFPQPASDPRPLLGLSSMQQFIYSVSPTNPLCDAHIIARGLEKLFQTGLLIRVHEKFFLNFYLK
jgi:hypothetical protein